jgi:hypothetical protein
VVYEAPKNDRVARLVHFEDDDVVHDALAAEPDERAGLRFADT